MSTINSVKCKCFLPCADFNMSLINIPQFSSSFLISGTTQQSFLQILLSRPHSQTGVSDLETKVIKGLSHLVVEEEDSDLSHVKCTISLIDLSKSSTSILTEYDTSKLYMFCND